MGQVLKFPGGVEIRSGATKTVDFDNETARNTAIMALQLNDNIHQFFLHLEKLEEQGVINSEDAERIEQLAHLGTPDDD
jgi:hypothetical protein